MAKARKLPSGSWRAQVYAGQDETGKRVYKSFTAPTRKEAEYLAAQWALTRKEDNRSESLTFHKAIDRYIDAKSQVLSPSTIRGYRIMQRNAFPLLSQKPIGKLQQGDMIQRQINDNARKYSAKSLRNQLGLITAVLGFHGLSVPRVTLNPTENKTIPVPTLEDAKKIMKILEGSTIECQALLALTCSLRQSEIAAILPDDINGNQINIHGALVTGPENRLVYKPTPKSSAGNRIITMPDFLSDKVLMAVSNCRAGERVFPTHPSSVLRTFKKELIESGVYPYSIHALRHCFAALMHAQGIQDRYVMEMGGWSSDHVLKRTYQYSFSEEVQRAKEEANKFFEMQHEMQHNED